MKTTPISWQYWARILVLMALVFPLSGNSHQILRIEASPVQTGDRFALTLDPVLREDVNQAAEEILFYDGFESGSLGSAWSTATTLSGRVQISTTYPYTGTYSLLLDDAGGSDVSLAAAILTVDLSGQTEAALTFAWREFSDEDNAEDGVFLSDDDGATWQPVWSFNGDYGSTWQLSVIDLDAEAALGGLSLHDHFQIKFQFYDNASIDTDGYAIDEVRVQSYPAAIPAIPPFYDGFENGTLGAPWNADFTREGRVWLSPDYAYAGSYSLLMDDSGGSEYSLAMAILHLDLSGTAQVELDFMWREFDDEDHPEDGVFISNDGTTWHPVLSFNGEYGSEWRQGVIDLDEAADSSGLALTDDFQVKFQFYDNGAIETDGYALDEVRVRPLSPASYPFETGFEDGVLNPAWEIVKTNAGRVEINSAYPYTGTYSLVLDDTGGSDMSFAAAVLHVDLNTAGETVLEFNWREFEDEDNPEDGVFISDNGGTDWHPLLSFTGDYGTTWLHEVVDLSAAASSAGLALNDHFLIKFQFYDNAPVPTDGYAFDNIRLRANLAPGLEWPGYPGYVADGLEPESGNTRTLFEYQVRYLDPEGDPPGEVRTHILQDGKEIAGSPFAMDCPAGEYSTGVICSHEHDGLVVGSDYSYFFSGEDDHGNPAMSTPELNGPEVHLTFWIHVPLTPNEVGPPAKPPVLAEISNPGGDYRFEVSWSEVVRATHYTLEQDQAPDFTTANTVYSGSSTSTNLSVDQVGIYYFRVKANNDYGETGWSNIQSVQVTIPPPPCPTTGLWTGTTDQGTSISFTVSDTPQCQVESLVVHYYICGQRVWTEFLNVYPISNNHFYAGGSQAWLSGDFPTRSTADGEFYFEMMCPTYPPIPDFSDGTWTASPQK